ncbi:MAG: DUF2703 domain-containing protein [Candidatus Eremiobacteraeota bacterium]|nr:DUF2703 domain-containing protein [Candidatus Eremiobacteraeota bacterium]
MNVQERAFDAYFQNAPNASDDLTRSMQGSVRPRVNAGDRLGALLPSLARRTGNDAPMVPLQGGTGGWQGIIQKLLGLFDQIFALLGLSSSNGPTGNQQRFQNATGSSTGDPHLAFQGTSDGKNTAFHFDSMTDHSNLIDSDSFDGGYSVSTKATQAGANGVTFNQSATVSTQNGNTAVSLDRNGNVSITSDGQMRSIAAGQTLDLGGGESVTQNADGSLTVSDDNGFGSILTTTLAKGGSGVDVSVTAQNADLGGDLVDSAAPDSGPVGRHHERIGVAPVTIEIFAFAGCPNLEQTRANVHRALADEAIDANITQIEVDTPEEAMSLRFLGSPSVRVNGRDIEPGAEQRLDYGLMCRTYAVGGNVSGAPTVEMIRRAFR